MRQTILLVTTLTLYGCIDGDPHMKLAVSIPTTASTCSVTDVEDGALVSCPDGTSEYVYDGANGADGKDGEKGDKGDTGEQGLPGENGKDGVDGQDGEQGPMGPVGPQGPSGLSNTPGLTGYIVGYIDPCGDSTGLDEILFVLSDGKYAAWYFNVGMVVLTDGTYKTTDAQACHFTISNNGYLYNE